MPKRERERERERQKKKSTSVEHSTDTLKLLQPGGSTETCSHHFHMITRGTRGRHIQSSSNTSVLATGLPSKGVDDTLHVHIAALISGFQLHAPCSLYLSYDCMTLATILVCICICTHQECNNYFLWRRASWLCGWKNSCDLQAPTVFRRYSPTLNTEGDIQSQQTTQTIIITLALSHQLHSHTVVAASDQLLEVRPMNDKLASYPGSSPEPGYEATVNQLVVGMEWLRNNS